MISQDFRVRHDVDLRERTNYCMLKLIFRDETETLDVNLSPKPKKKEETISQSMLYILNLLGQP